MVKTSSWTGEFRISFYLSENNNIPLAVHAAPSQGYKTAQENKQAVLAPQDASSPVTTEIHVTGHMSLTDEELTQLPYLRDCSHCSKKLLQQC